MLIGGLQMELVSAKADVAELKEGEDNFGVLERKEAEMGGDCNVVLRFWQLACKLSWGVLDDTVEDGPVPEARSRLGVMALFARSRTESIPKQSRPAEPFTSIGSGEDRQDCGCSEKADFEERL